MNTFTYYNKVTYTSVLDYHTSKTSNICNPSLSCIALRHHYCRPQTLEYQSRTLDSIRSRIELFFALGVEQ